MTQLTVIPGDLERQEVLRNTLLMRPWEFSHDEFDLLCERFGLSRAEIHDLTLERIRRRANNSHEAKAVLDLLEGRASLSSAKAMIRRSAIRIVSALPPSPLPTVGSIDSDPFLA